MDFVSYLTMANLCNPDWYNCLRRTLVDVHCCRHHYCEIAHSVRPVMTWKIMSCRLESRSQSAVPPWGVVKSALSLWVMIEWVLSLRAPITGPSPDEDENICKVHVSVRAAALCPIAPVIGSDNWPIGSRCGRAFSLGSVLSRRKIISEKRNKHARAPRWLVAKREKPTNVLPSNVFFRFSLLFFVSMLSQFRSSLFIQIITYLPFLFRSPMRLSICETHSV